MLPPVGHGRCRSALRSRSAISERGGRHPPRPRRTFLPGWSFSLSTMRCSAAVKSVGAHRQVFLVHDLGVLERNFEGLHAVAAEGVVVGQGGDNGARCSRSAAALAGGVLRAAAPGAEDVLVPLVAGDRIGHGRLDQQDLLVLLGHRQHGQRDRRCGRADGDVDLVVTIGRGQRGLAHIRLALIVLLDDHQLLAGHHHRAAGGVVQAHVEADDGLLSIGLQRAGLAGDDGDLDFALGLGHCRGQGQHGHRGAQRGGLEPCRKGRFHRSVSLIAGRDCSGGAVVWPSKSQGACHRAPHQCKPLTDCARCPRTRSLHSKSGSQANKPQTRLSGLFTLHPDLELAVYGFHTARAACPASSSLHPSADSKT